MYHSRELVSRAVAHDLVRICERYMVVVPVGGSRYYLQPITLDHMTCLIDSIPESRLFEVCRTDTGALILGSPCGEIIL